MSLRLLLPVAISAAVSLIMSSSGLAQGILPDELRNIGNDIQQQQIQQTEEQERRRREFEEREDVVQDQTAGAEFYAPPPGGPCFEIRSIDLEGFEAFKEEPKGYRDLIGTCATAADIAQTLNLINTFYQELGFITTRAYVPEQDIADGSLAITIVPGRIEGYVYGIGKPADARLNAAFPTGRGDLLNLRNLEQGLENINAPRSASGQFQLVPGETPGGSFIQVDVQDRRPWYLDFQFDNSGFESTGRIKGTSIFGLDNGLNLNDQLRIGITTTPFEERGERYSDSVSVNWGLPVGNWLFNADFGASDYRFITQGINQSFVTEGRSQYLILLTERLLMRNQTSKIYAYGDLKLNRTKTSINGIDITSQRQRLTIASLGLRGEKTIGQGRLFWNIGVKAGLDALGADIPERSVIDQEFRLVKLRADVSAPIGKSGLTYRGTLAGQYSDDILPGIEQFGVGGWSTVRGFHDNSLYGDTGIYLRNTVEWGAYKAAKFEVRMNAGLDFGYVKPSTLRRWSQDHLAGVSLGADIIMNNQVTLQMQVAHALSRPDDSSPNTNPAFESDKTVGYVSLRMEF
ncbi:hemolysin activation protein [Ruegeria sp. ANG-R]|uniref:ShlB/FhaC/HecB family hemolysin secretion/activation protein n=1 Tax=Ruegeria sp. ANG-R TaxID=1577903 RepID=UPI000580002F|nr:ShlB/FhaC/HecB family hemolysin secretion/activation protein [Ruegeria sp. ANG-R]KIC36440.1 hemolysin activation protein [Ruegeria sp. ANG-R]